MGLLSNILARTPLVSESGLGSFFSGASLFRGNAISISPQTALQLTTVFACNRVIAETLSSISLDVFESVEKGKEKATDHPLYALLKYAPNPNITSVMWREMIVQDLNTRGNHYSQIIYNHNKNITAIYPLIADNMEVKLRKGGKLVYIYTTANGKVEVPQRDVLHIRGLPSDDGITGLSPIAYNKRALELGATTQEFGRSFFERGANAMGAFSTPGELSDEAYQRLKKNLNENYAGMKNSGKPLLLEGGLKFERISIPNNEAQFLETRKYQKEEIASIFRVPMHMINSLENATFSNIEHQSLEFVQFTMLPWIKRIEQAMMQALLTEEERKRYAIKFDVDTLLRGDFATRTDGYAKLFNIGALSQNDIRALENMNSIGEAGDRYFVQLNMAEATKGETK